MVVLYFYPRDNTPGCTIEAQDFRMRCRRWRSSARPCSASARTRSRRTASSGTSSSSTFPLLTDADGKMMAAYGAWGEKLMYGKKMKGIIRSTVLIDKTARSLATGPRSASKATSTKWSKR